MNEAKNNVAGSKRKTSSTERKEDETSKKPKTEDPKFISESDYLIKLYEKTPTKRNSNHDSRLKKKGLIDDKNGKPYFNDDLIKNFFIKKFDRIIGSDLYTVYNQLNGAAASPLNELSILLAAVSYMIKGAPPEEALKKAITDAAKKATEEVGEEIEEEALKKANKKAGEKTEEKSEEGDEEGEKKSDKKSKNNYDFLFAIFLILKSQEKDEGLTARKINESIFPTAPQDDNQDTNTREALTKYSKRESGFFEKHGSKTPYTFSINVNKIEHFILENSFEKDFFEKLKTAYDKAKALKNGEAGRPQKTEPNDNEKLKKNSATDAQTHPAMNPSTSSSSAAETKEIKSNSKILVPNPMAVAQAPPSIDISASSSSAEALKRSNTKDEDDTKAEATKSNTRQTTFPPFPTSTAKIERKAGDRRGSQAATTPVNNTVKIKSNHNLAKALQFFQVHLFSLINRRHDKFAFYVQQLSDRILVIKFTRANEVVMKSEEIRSELVDLWRSFKKIGIEIETREADFSNWSLTIRAEPASIKRILRIFKQIEKETSAPIAAATQAPHAAMFSSATNLRGALSQGSSSVSSVENKTSIRIAAATQAPPHATMSPPPASLGDTPSQVGAPAAPEAEEVITEATCVIQ